jgi:hypothetical protein
MLKMNRICLKNIFPAFAKGVGLLFLLYSQFLVPHPAFAQADILLEIGSSSIDALSNGVIIPIYLTNGEDIAGVEFGFADDLGLVTIKGVTTTERSADFTAMTNANRVLLFHLAGESIKPGSGEILHLAVEIKDANVSGTDTLRFAYGPIAATAQGVRIDSVATKNGVFDFSYPVAVGERNPLPISYFLEQNYPNPFNNSTAIRFGLERDGRVKLAVFNTKGELVETLLDGLLAKGVHKIDFNPAALPSGIYFVRLLAEEFEAVRKIMLIR